MFSSPPNTRSCLLGRYNKAGGRFPAGQDDGGRGASLHRQGTSSRRAGPAPFVGSVFQGQSLERNGASVGSKGLSPRFAISRSIAALPPPPSSSTSMRK